MDRYDEIRAMYTSYIGRVAGFARKEYLRTLRYREEEIGFSNLPEDRLVLPSVRTSDEFDFAEERLSQAITDLPLLRRQVLEMIFIEQLTAPEISERLGCSVNYVYKQKHLALRKIEAILREGGFGSEQ